jgi:hypothetical protein
MSTSTPQGPGRPDFIVSTTEMGVVMYAEKKAVGLQFVDPNGQQAFLWVPGKILAQLAETIPEFLESHPEVLDWNPPPNRKN